jgi:hypothetical protein
MTNNNSFLENFIKELEKIVDDKLTDLKKYFIEDFDYNFIIIKYIEELDNETLLNGWNDDTILNIIINAIDSEIEYLTNSERKSLCTVLDFLHPLTQYKSFTITDYLIEYLYDNNDWEELLGKEIDTLWDKEVKKRNL